MTCFLFLLDSSAPDTQTTEKILQLTKISTNQCMPKLHDLQSSFLWERPEDQQKRFSTVKDIKKEPHHNEMLGGTETQYSLDPHPWVGDPHKEEHYNLRGLPPGVRGPSPTWVPQPCTGKRSPQNNWLGKPAGLMFRRTGGLHQTDNPPLKGAYKVSHAPRPSAEAVVWEEPGSDTCWSLRASWRGRRNLGLPQGT